MSAPAAPKFIGARVRRKEDPRLITGTATYTDDIVLPRMAHAAFTRSPQAHARIVSIDTSAAAAMPGVVAVYTGDDLAVYDNIRTRYGIVVVATLRDGVCSFCAVAPSRTKLKAIKSHRELLQCGNCKRVLLDL